MLVFTFLHKHELTTHSSKLDFLHLMRTLPRTRGARLGQLPHSSVSQSPCLWSAGDSPLITSFRELLRDEWDRSTRLETMPSTFRKWQTLLLNQSVALRGSALIID